MQFKQDAAVYSADGRVVGRVDRVVMDPRTKEITHLVIRQGLLFTEDKMLSIKLVAGTSENRVELRADVDSLNNLQNFEETYYVAGDGELRADYPTDFAHPVYAYPPVAGTVIGGLPIVPDPTASLHADIAHTELNIPEDTVALKQGARVMSADDEHVGNVERIFTASDSGQATHFLIAQGLLFKAHKLIPATWIESITPNEVRLAVSADLLQTLRDYQE